MQFNQISWWVFYHSRAPIACPMDLITITKLLCGCKIIWMKCYRNDVHVNTRLIMVIRSDWNGEYDAKDSIKMLIVKKTRRNPFFMLLCFSLILRISSKLSFYKIDRELQEEMKTKKNSIQQQYVLVSLFISLKIHTKRETIDCFKYSIYIISCCIKHTHS